MLLATRMEGIDQLGSFYYCFEPNYEKRSQRSCELPTPSSSRLVSMSTYLRSDPVHGCDPLLDGTQRKRGFTFDQMRAVDQPVATRPFHLM